MPKFRKQLNPLLLSVVLPSFVALASAGEQAEVAKKAPQAVITAVTVHEESSSAVIDSSSEISSPEQVPLEGPAVEVVQPLAAVPPAAEQLAAEPLAAESLAAVVSAEQPAVPLESAVAVESKRAEAPRTHPVPAIAPQAQQTTAEQRRQAERRLTPAQRATINQELRSLAAVAHDRYKADKAMRKQFTAANSKFFGQDLWNDISALTTAGVVMVEKHYQNGESVISGAQCLNKLRGWRGQLQKFASLPRDEVTTLKAGIKKLSSECQAKLHVYKEDKKNRDIQRMKALDTEARMVVSEELKPFFSDNAKLFSLIEKTYDSRFMSCRPQGGSASAAWFVGGGVSLYKLDCNTLLGQRMRYVYGGGTVGMGFGGFVGTIDAMQHSYDAASDRYYPLLYRLPYDSAGFKVHPQGQATLGIGVGLGLEVNGLFDNEEVGIGFGLIAGLGGSVLYKSKEKTPDYRELYRAMEMDFKDLAYPALSVPPRNRQKPEAKP